MAGTRKKQAVEMCTVATREDVAMQSNTIEMSHGELFKIFRVTSFFSLSHVL